MELVFVALYTTKLANLLLERLRAIGHFTSIFASQEKHYFNLYMIVNTKTSLNNDNDENG